MFARPSAQKKSLQQKKSLVVQRPTKKTVFTNLNGRNPARQPCINKIASIRTLPPFSAFINSSSGANSQRKSIQYSQSNSELQIWRDQDELFTNSSVKQAINSIDQQLRDVLQTIKKQRNLIDLKITKLRAKIQQTRSRSNTRKLQLNFEQSMKQVGVSTSEGIQDMKKIKSQGKHIGTQCPPDKSQYFYSMALSLGLIEKEESRNVVEQVIDQETKIRQNKQILQMLFDKMGSI